MEGGLLPILTQSNALISSEFPLTPLQILDVFTHQRKIAISLPLKVVGWYAIECDLIYVFMYSLVFCL